MLPLSIFLLIWLGLLGIHLIMSLITVVQMTRFGIAGFGTVAATTVFLGLLAVILLVSGAYFLTVDWSQTIAPFEGFTSSPFFNP